MALNGDTSLGQGDALAVEAEEEHRLCRDGGIVGHCGRLNAYGALNALVAERHHGAVLHARSYGHRFDDNAVAGDDDGFGVGRRW